MRVLSLTSPPMKGEDVKEAQRLLRKYGTWTGKIDGVYGEMTARATAQAKFKLGYRQANIDRTFGKELKFFLNGVKPQTPLMKQRAKKRMAKPPLRTPALVEAKKYVGVKESPPNSNRVKFSLWYGMIGPWCAMYVTWCYTIAGSKHFNKNAARWAYCPYMLNDARAQRNGLTVVPKEQAQPGDIVLFSWKQNGVADHVGLLTTKVSRHGDFKSIEGNTSPSSNSDGGEVMIRSRNTKHVIAFVRVWE
jgi:hypothetical protein